MLISMFASNTTSCTTASAPSQYPGLQGRYTYRDLPQAQRQSTTGQKYGQKCPHPKLDISPLTPGRNMDTNAPVFNQLFHQEPLLSLALYICAFLNQTAEFVIISPFVLTILNLLPRSLWPRLWFLETLVTKNDLSVTTCSKISTWLKEHL